MGLVGVPVVGVLGPDHLVVFHQLGHAERSVVDAQGPVLAPLVAGSLGQILTGGIQRGGHQLGLEGGVGDLQGDLEGVVVHSHGHHAVGGAGAVVVLLGAHHIEDEGGVVVQVLGVDQPLPAVLIVVGGDGLAVRPLGVGLQVEGVDGAVVRHIHRLCTVQHKVLAGVIGHIAVQAGIARCHHPAPAHILHVIVVAKGSGADVQHLGVCTALGSAGNSSRAAVVRAAAARQDGGQAGSTHHTQNRASFQFHSTHFPLFCIDCRQGNSFKQPFSSLIQGQVAALCG